MRSYFISPIGYIYLAIYLAVSGVIFSLTTLLAGQGSDITSYFSYTDRFRGDMMAPQITQVHLEDFGLSYVIRLSDGRFIIFDGGWNFEPDRNRLFECLKAGSPDEKPVIAAWILTHPHGDHYLCFLGFMEQYGDQVVIEKFLFNFPEFDDIEHTPS